MKISLKSIAFILYISLLSTTTHSMNTQTGLKENSYSVFVDLLQKLGDMNEVFLYIIKRENRIPINQILEILKFLLDKKDVDINCTDHLTGETGLHKSKQSEITTFLISYGADLNIQCSDFGYTPLMQATYFSPKTVTLLIGAGCDLDKQDKDGKTALIHVTMYDKKEIAEKLIAAGADLDIRDNKGLTALMYAAIYDKKEMIQMLIDAGADLKLSDLARSNAKAENIEMIDKVGQARRNLYFQLITTITKARLKAKSIALKLT